MSMHPNSLAAYQSLDIGERARVVLRCYMETLQPMTDREAKERLKFEDMNQVRPRVTELVESRWLEECGVALDHASGKEVRLCRPTAMAIERVRAADPFRKACKQVAAYVANVGDMGATEADILRALPSIAAVDLPNLLKACEAFRAITQCAGVVRGDQLAWHITKRGLVALGKEPAAHWHVDQAERVRA